MKNKGMAGSGTVAVLANQPKKMTSRHEKIAGGKFSSCASAIELGEHSEYRDSKCTEADE
jgi:hypothetical protein